MFMLVFGPSSWPARYKPDWWLGSEFSRMNQLQRQFKFRKAQRIRSSEEFNRIFSRRCAVHGPSFGLYVDANEVGFARLGIRIGRRAGRAVLRVRSRRRLREAFRRVQHQLPPMDFIAVIRSTQPSSDEYESMLVALASKAQLKFDRNA